MTLKFYAKISFINIFLISFLMPLFTHGGTSIVINEIAWMGSLAEDGETKSQAANDEWIELYNASNTVIDLNGWVLHAYDNTPYIELRGEIKANEYFLLSRANDTVAHAKANIIYEYRNNALSNSGEHLMLKNKNGDIVDEINASQEWIAGNNSTKETMERSGEIWENGPIGGTPGRENSTYKEEIESNEIHTEEEATLEIKDQNEDHNDENKIITNNEEDKITEKELTKEYNTFNKHKDVKISEFLPNPNGADSQLEWIEIYNAGNMAHDISNWFLDDEEEGSNAYQFPENTNINANSYLVLSIGTTKLQLNNNTDSVRLAYPDNTVAYRVEYTDKAKEGLAYALVNDIWVWTDTPTPGSENIFYKKQKQEDKKVSKIEKQKEASLKKNDVKNTEEKSQIQSDKLTAKISKESNTNYFLPIIIGGLVSMAGGGVFLLIKKRNLF